MAVLMQAMLFTKGFNRICCLAYAKFSSPLLFRPQNVAFLFHNSESSFASSSLQLLLLSQLPSSKFRLFISLLITIQPLQFIHMHPSPITLYTMHVHSFSLQAFCLYNSTCSYIQLSISPQSILRIGWYVLNPFLPSFLPSFIFLFAQNSFKGGIIEEEEEGNSLIYRILNCINQRVFTLILGDLGWHISINCSASTWIYNIFNS